MNCDSCGTEVSEGDKFCKGCGKEFSSWKEGFQSNQDSDFTTESESSNSSSGSIGRLVSNLALILLAISVSGLIYSSIYTPDIDDQIFFSIAFGLGIMGSIVAWRMGASAIMWFLLSFVGLGAIVAFIVGYLRALIGT